MLKTTRVIHKYVYIHAESWKVCNFHIVKYDENSNNKHTAECWITGWNPMPISGKFNSSFDVFNNWMINNGWNVADYPEEIIIEKEKISDMPERRRN